MGKRSAYWKTVYSRAWRETWAKSPWSSSLRLFAALVAVAAPAAWGLFDTGELSYAGFWGLGAIGVLLIGMVVFHAHFSVPADMDAESCERISQLERDAEARKNAYPDTSLEEAVAYSLTGTWGQAIPWGNEGALSDVGEFLERLRQLAHLGCVRVWGKAGPHKPLSELNHDDWSKYGFDIASLTRLDQEGTCTSATGWSNIPYFRNLHVARAEIESEFRRT